MVCKFRILQTQDFSLQLQGLGHFPGCLQWKPSQGFDSLLLIGLQVYTAKAQTGHTSLFSSSIFYYQDSVC